MDYLFSIFWAVATAASMLWWMTSVQRQAETLELRLRRLERRAASTPGGPNGLATRLCIDDSGDLREMTVQQSRSRVALRPDGNLDVCDEDDPRPYVHLWTYDPSRCRDGEAFFEVEKRQVAVHRGVSHGPSP
jgi:hypothetical protein